MKEQAIHAPVVQETERQAYILRRKREAGNAWEFLSSAVNDIERFWTAGGKTVLFSPDTVELTVAADWSPSVLDRTVDTLLMKEEDTVSLRPNLNSFGHYIHFFKGYPTSASLESGVNQAMQENPDHASFFGHLFYLNPILGATTSILYNNAQRSVRSPSGEASVVTPFEAWYKESIDSLNSAATDVYDFFSGVDTKVKGNKQMTGQFLSDWQMESLLPIVEAASLANCFALSAQISNNAVLSTGVPATVTQAERNSMSKKIMSLWEPELHPDGRKTVYNERSNHTLELNKQNPFNPHIPILTSVIDIPAYSKFLQRYWEQIANGLQAKKGASIYTEYEGDSKKIRLGNAAEVFCRTHASSFGQARIYIQGTGNLTGFNIRVDNENMRSLSVDFGGVSTEQLIAYAEEVKKQDEISPVRTHYAPLVDKLGRLSTRRTDVPSIMKRSARYIDNTGTVQPLADGNKAALLASVAMQEGNNIGIRGADFYLYHSREHINKPEYVRNFPQIIKSISDALLS